MPIVGSQPERKVPQGLRSIARGIRDTPLLYLGDGSGWNGPGEAPAPNVPEGSDTRGWPYPVLWNSSGDARSSKARETSGGVSFPDFETLSKQVHVRAAAETVKNTQCKKEWVFSLRPLPGEQPMDVAARAAGDQRLVEIATFFERPDGEHDLPEWVRLLLEDLLINDAPTAYNIRRNNGKPYEIEIFSGATIKPLLAPDGRLPRGPEQEAYQQWLYGQAGEKFTRAEMIYAPRNPRPGKAYGCGPVEQLLFHINLALRKDLQRLATYTEGNIPAGMLPMPSTWSSKEIAQWFAEFNLFVKGIPSELAKFIPIPGGTGTPIFPALESVKDQWEESWIRLVCFGFDIPVQALVKEMNRATAEVGRDSAMQDGQAGYTDWVRRFLNRVIRDWFGYPDIIAIPKIEADVEAKTQADIDHLEILDGTLQVNEKRQRMGRPPFKELEGKVGYFGPGGFTSFEAPPLVPFGQPTVVTPLAEQGAAPEPVTPAPTGASRVSTELRVGDVEAARAIAKDVVKGDMLRDAALGQLKVLLGFSEAEALEILGSAGIPNVPATPNPQPTDGAAVEPAAAAAETAKAEEGPLEFSSTQVNITGPIAAAIAAMATEIPNDVLAEKWRETDVHVTVKYGLDPNVTSAELAAALANAESVKAIAAQGGSMTLRSTAMFESEKYDVVYIAVDSADLVTLNAVISAALPVTDTHPKYVPHVTLAYVKSGCGKDFVGNPTLDGVAIRFKEIVFSTTDGSEITLPLVQPTEARKSAKVVTMPSVIKGAEVDLAKTVAQFLSEQLPIAQKAALTYFETLSATETQKADEASVEIDWSDLIAKLEPILKGTYTHVGGAAFKQTGASGAFNRVNEAAAEYARKRAAELVGMKWVDGKLVDNPDAALAISNSTREKLRSLAESAFSDGLSPAQLTEKIEETGEFSEARANSIAETEITEVQSAAAVEGWKQSGLVTKNRWLLAGEPCAICVGNADAGEIELGKAFPSGHSRPTAHPHCHCDLAAVVEESAA